jgi:hypothetical protein
VGQDEKELEDMKKVDFQNRSGLKFRVENYFYQ